MAQPKKKRSLWLVIGLLIAVLMVYFCLPEDSPPRSDGNSAAEDSGAVTTERLPGLPADYAHHVLLDERRDGPCDTLTGKVFITMVMVDDDGGQWTDTALADCKTIQAEATEKLEAEAARYGAQLDVTLQYVRCQISGSIAMKEDSDWIDRALAAAELPQRKAAIDSLKAQYGAKEAPVIFCVNYGGRSFANQSQDFEFAVLFSGLPDYRHELNHVFGAEDYYYPETVRKAATRLFPDSIMLTREAGATADDLCAYLVGWTDEPSAKALDLLAESAEITQQDVYAAYQEETYTGYVTDRFMDTGTYTGYVEDGSPNGTGTFVWTNGDVYTGEWKDALMHGRGELSYKSGASYSGYWAEGVRSGEGIYYYTDGSFYSGNWEKGDRSGHGWMKWTDGTEYTGEWANDTMHGYGKCTFPDGTVNEGRWENGKFIG